MDKTLSVTISKKDLVFFGSITSCDKANFLLTLPYVLVMLIQKFLPCPRDPSAKFPTSIRLGVSALRWWLLPLIRMWLDIVSIIPPSEDLFQLHQTVIRTCDCVSATAWSKCPNSFDKVKELATLPEICFRAMTREVISPHQKVDPFQFREIFFYNQKTREK